MAITNYGELKAAVANWLNRTDLTARVPEFISLANQRIFFGGSEPYPSQPLRVPAMQSRATGSVSNSSIAFPSDFLEPIRLSLSSGGVSFSATYLPPERYSEASNSQATPGTYTYLNNTIALAGTGAASYTLDYYAKPAAFSADEDTNWLLTNAPGVYLYASLLETSPFVYDDPRINLWFGSFKSSIASLNQSTQRKAPGSLQMVVVR